MLDTRAGGATIDGADAGGGERGAGSVTELHVAPRAGVPGDASAVVLNVTAADAGSSGYVTVWPCGEPRPNASNVNYRPGGAVANVVIVRVGVGGKVCMFTETATQLIVDINGWYAAGARFVSGSPSRVLDTRAGGATIDGADAGGGERGAGSVTELHVAPRAGVPGDASAVVLNVTAADAGSSGYVTVWPCGEPRPNASNVNYRPGGAVANAVIVRVGVGGKVCMFTETATQLIVDINGWYPVATDFTATTPSRLLDTRTSSPGSVSPGTAPAPAGSPGSVSPGTAPAPAGSPGSVSPGSTPVPAGAQFVETFDSNSGLGRFDLGIYHRDDVLQRVTEWTGDHDMACGSPDTQRLIHRSNPAESFYLCNDHLMTSVGDTAGYSTAWFSPKATFTGVRQVSWDVNVTNLGARKWWEVAVMPASFDSGVPSCPHCAVQSWLSPSPSGLPAYPSDAVVVGNGPFGSTFHVHAGGQDFNPSGWQHTCGDAFALDPEGCASKAIRRTFTITDNGNGTLTLNAFGQTYSFAGSFPSGPVKVVFKDHNYTPDKDGVPVGHTWHWDSVIVR